MSKEAGTRPFLILGIGYYRDWSNWVKAVPCLWAGTYLDVGRLAGCIWSNELRIKGHWA